MAMTYKEIKELLEIVGESDLAEFKLKDGDFEVSIRTGSYSKVKMTSQPMMAAPAMAAQPIQQVAAAPAPASAAPAAQPAAEADSTEGLLEVKSPIVGTFYRSASPDKAAFVSIGDTISEGSVVCIVEAMKLFNEIESEVAGKIVKVLVEDASPVEYDQVLFLVDPKG
jgi:acetyl-CoA carboxylase biotin carboxyl carrier protein